jgi:TetR/AcrR family transcriptional regulator
MARGRSPGYDEQRELILARAAQLFAQRGYPATSMNEVADACGMSKPALYHYYKDKYTLLVQSAEAHVVRLEALVREVDALQLAPEPRLRAMIERFVAEYASAQHAHRVLTEDVKFLAEADRARIVAAQRRVVAAFARALGELRPDLEAAALATPLTMLLFGMINWMFTWLKPGGTLSHEAMAPLVAQLFFGGVPAVRAAEPAKPTARKTARSQPKETA